MDSSQISQFFTAPWGNEVWGITIGIIILCLGMALGGFFTRKKMPAPLVPFVIALPVIIPAFCSLFAIRGYEIRPGKLIVQRTVWQETIPLSDLKSVEYKAEIMKKSYRTLANGGVFGFIGNFSNKKLGAYRALVTDLNKTVILKFASHTLVVSPGQPEAFVLAAGAAAKTP
ncbi:MAG: PH domain-containing protein [Verrucomicrobiae bacterium]|nr:PH domain-containing protein [Verrucomicrobiae bacterium]